MKRIKGTVVLLLILAAVLTPVALVVTGALPYRAYVVRTGSMAPSILPASVVIVEAGEYSVGQVVTFRHRGDRITHRFVTINADGSLTTRGDANETVDPFTVPKEDVIGGVVGFVPFLGYVVIFLQNPLALGSLIMLMLSLWYVASDAETPEQKQKATEKTGSDLVPAQTTQPPSAIAVVPPI